MIFDAIIGEQLRQKSLIRHNLSAICYICLILLPQIVFFRQKFSHSLYRLDNKLR